ncbi:integumentary mucin C.1-like [Mercenaria mercenaria]|uniref:integumentary mucin C.1-like n=1 Tax=Mercenaria mercenaria TaxID=6596 RepID=UPI00234EC118|nr:integumentary mucin C.1-like [Mercenaria mercenaria]
MAAAVLLKHTVLIVLACLVYDAHAKPNGRGRSFEKCRKDLERCMSSGRGFACQGTGLKVMCRQRGVMCDGNVDCPWGEDEKYCNRLTIRPSSRTKFTTTTIVRTTTTTQTSTTTSTRTNSVTSTSTTTSQGASPSITTTTSTPFVSLASSSAWFATTVTSTLTEAVIAAVRLNSGDPIPAGSTCILRAVDAGADVGDSDFRFSRTSTESILIVSVTATCTPTTATVH